MRLIFLTTLIAIVASLAQADPPQKASGEKPAAKTTRPKSDRPAKPTARTAERRAAQRAAAERAAAERKHALMAKTPVTPTREKLALNFAKKHHRELAGLLESLKSMNQTHYRTAVWEVARDAERLGRLQQRTDKRYEPSLRIWKLDSRIRIEAARFSMNQSESTEKKLRQLMLARRKARLAYLTVDRKRSQARTDRIDEQIEAVSTNPEQAVAAEIDRLRRSLAARTRSGAQSSTPRSKRPTVPQPAVRNASATRTKPTRKETSVSKSQPENTP